MKAILFVLAIYFHLLSPLSLYAADASNKSLTMPSQQRILDCIKRFTALDESFAIESIESVSLSELPLPFLGRQLQGQLGIRVRFKPGKIKWREPLGGVEDSYMRHFTVYLDADARRLLGVKSRLAERSRDIREEPPPEEAETQLRQSGVSYEAFPMGTPKVSFMDALESVRASSISSPRFAQEIDGFYLMYKVGNQKPYAVWIINLRGLPPMHVSRPFGGAQPPVWTRNYSRSIVDAITGKWIATSNSPRPR